MAQAFFSDSEESKDKPADLLYASKTELLRVRNIRSQRHPVPVPLKKRVHTPVALMSQSSNVSAYMYVRKHSQPVCRGH